MSLSGGNRSLTVRSALAEIVSKRLSFLVCGAQKSGTTALAAYLRQHPGIHLPKAKELHFFDDETQAWPQPDLNALHRHFQAAKGSALGRGDADQPLLGSSSRADLALQLGDAPDCDSAQSDRAGLLTLGNGAPAGKRSAALRPCAGTRGGPLPRSPAPPAPGFLLRRPWLLQRSAQATLALLRAESRCWCSDKRICDLSPQTCLDRIWQHLSIPSGPSHHSARTPQR